MNTNISTLSGIIVVAVVAAASGAFIFSEFEKQDFDFSPIIAQYDVSKTDTDKGANEGGEVVCKNESASGVDLPAIRFIPAIFSDEEREELTEKVINPFIEFEKESYVENGIISIAVNKYSDSELAEMKDPKYIYKIDVVYHEGWGGWLEREAGEKIDWWVPDCLDGCEFSDEFKERYPEVVEKYDDLQNSQE
ncbi:MAG: hypothetical protein PHH24_02130 [Candidatus Moranbacteria bacterium]|jgi:hypothetical protein|nr:hypothetical protein [Candidatus Moranbacteria bacterium]MDD5652147.1 hypothetical protein [Candidatus Moranbacteria bacterium]MDX9855963.1 hypothetical protein [Candidatus Moranbacteria bacterium]